jgi:hypothetical protein
VVTPISKFKIRSRVHTHTTAAPPSRAPTIYKPAPQHHSDPSVYLLPPPPRPNPLPSPSSRRATTCPVSPEARSHDEGRRHEVLLPAAEGAHRHQAHRRRLQEDRGGGGGAPPPEGRARPPGSPGHR